MDPASPRHVPYPDVPRRCRQYGFDAPTESLRVWDRLFFVNRRRLRNCVAAGAIEADSAAIRLIGMPKVDRLVDGSLQRLAVLTSLGLDPERSTVLYAPTWSPQSSLNRLGIDLIRRLAALRVNVIVKLHDRSRDARARYSGGVDWPAAVADVLPAGRGVLAPSSDICPYLEAADLMVTDHSSAGFEYLLLDRPIVRIHVPELIESAQVHGDYVSLLTDVSESVVADAALTVRAIERGLANPACKSASRREVAADLFHDPGNATIRAVAALYEAIELAPPSPDDSAFDFGWASTPSLYGQTTNVGAVSPDLLARASQHLAPGTGHPGRGSSRSAMSVPTVSVVMPAFNAAAYVDRAITSVLRQTVKNIELLVVDDGSSDDTAAIVARRAVHDERVQLFRQANAGPGPARNIAFQVAKGRFFAFLDSDDAWTPTFLERQVSILESRPDIDVVFGNAWCHGGPRDGKPARPTRARSAPPSARGPSRGRQPAFHHGGLPPRGNRPRRWVRSALPDQRRVRAVAAGWPRRLHVWPQSRTARLVHLPARQLVVVRHKNARGRSARPRTHAAVADRGVARACDAGPVSSSDQADLAAARVRQPDSERCVGGADPFGGAPPAARWLDVGARREGAARSDGVISLPASGAKCSMSVRRVVDSTAGALLLEPR